MKFSEFVNQNIDESIMGFKLDNTKMPKEFVADYDADYPRDLYKEYDKLRRKTEAARKRLLFKKDSDYQDFQKYDLQYLTKEKAEEKLKIAKVQRSKIEALEKEIKGWAKKIQDIIKTLVYGVTSKKH